MFLPLVRRIQTSLLQRTAAATASWRPSTTAAAASLSTTATATSTLDNNNNNNNNNARDTVQFLRLNNLQDNPGSSHQKRRVGRGVGSGRGKTSTRGHKGQKARSGGSIHPTFEGGQTKFYKLLPKRGFNNTRHAAHMFPINLGTLQMYIDMGRIDGTKLITLKELMDAGLFKANAVKNGVKLLSDGKERLKTPIQIECSRASGQAIQALEAIGGQVTTVHYNRLSLRQMLRPEKFDAPVRQARPPPKWQPYYSSWDKRGYLNPAVQLRNWLADKPELSDKFDAIMANDANEDKE